MSLLSLSILNILIKQSKYIKTLKKVVRAFKTFWKKTA